MLLLSLFVLSTLFPLFSHDVHACHESFSFISIFSTVRKFIKQKFLLLGD
jgi:hypothetical protein